MIQAEPILPCGCTRSFLTYGISNPFVPGWLSTSVIHKVYHRYGPCVTTQHNPNNHSTQVFHLLSCCGIPRKPLLENRVDFVHCIIMTACSCPHATLHLSIVIIMHCLSETIFETPSFVF